jgi:uncharacterized iron-regulated membrane protein
MPLRRLWLRLHRWIALGLGVPLALVALCGAALTVVEPLDHRAHPRLFVAAVGATSDPDVLEHARLRLRAEFGADAAFTFRPPRAERDTLWVLVRGPWRGTVYLDPATGAELGRRGEHEGVYNALFELHSSLLLGDRGKAILAVLAAAYVVLLASGLLLWWPKRWRHAWRVELRRGALRTLFDLHRVGGALLGVGVAVTVATGAYMAWRPLSDGVTAIAGAAPLRPPAVPEADATAPLSLDAAVREAAALFPQGRVGYVQVPGGRSKPVRVRLRLPDDPHPNGLTSVWLHPVTGARLAVHRWDRLDAGARAYSVVYPLHIGELGGPAHLALNAVLGLALAGFAVSGLWLWWQRR